MDVVSQCLSREGIIFFVTLILIFFAYNFQWKNRLPPGPWGFPIVGNLPQFGLEPYKVFMELAMRYGNVFRVRLGCWSAIVVNGHVAVREVLIAQSNVFAGRPAFHTSLNLCDGKSMTFSTNFDKRWKLHRKIVNNALRMAVDIKSDNIHDIIHGETNILIKEFKKSHGEAFDPTQIIQICACSVIYQILYGYVKDIRTDELFWKQMSNNREFLEFSGTENALNVVPIMRFLNPKAPAILCKIIKLAESIWEKKVKEHRVTFCPDNIRDVCDGLIAAISDCKPDVREKAGLKEREVFYTLQDLSGAGSETISSTLQWLVLYMALFPKVQEKVYDEIIKVVGATSTICATHRSQLPYTEATILESLRMSAVIPLGIPHMNTQDAILDGYTIPKGTVVIPNLYSLGHDPQTWAAPGEFQPEKFLSGDGEVNRNKAALIMPFGGGRRRCIGEFIARVELFLFFASTIQHCRIVKPKNMALNTEAELGLSLCPKPFKIEVEMR